jgi:hypothetical protein
MGLNIETWLGNCWPPHDQTIAQPSFKKLHLKNKQKLCHAEIINGIVYSQAHLPKVGAIRPAQFEGTRLRETSKMKGPINHLIIQNCTPHTDNVRYLKATREDSHLTKHENCVYY